jgi:putative transposase
LTEASGRLPVSLAIDGTNRYDMKLTRATLAALVIPRPVPTREQPQNLCLDKDKGYDYDEVRELAEAFGYTEPIRVRGEEAQAVKRETGFKALRWVVDRTHRWMNRFRRILIRWEKRAESYLAMPHLACGIITWRATGLLG